MPKCNLEQWFSLGGWDLEVIFLLSALEFCGLITLTAIDGIKKRSSDVICGLEELGVSRPKSSVMRAGASVNSGWWWRTALFSPYSHQALSRLQLICLCSWNHVTLSWSSQLFEAIIAFSLPIRELTWPIPLDRDQKYYAFDPSLRSHTLRSYNLSFYTTAQNGDLPPTPPFSANAYWYEQPAGTRMHNYV